MKVVIADVFIKQKKIIIHACIRTRCRTTHKMVKSMVGIHIARIFKSQKVIMSYGVSFVMVPNDGHKMLTIYLK
jgi:hypothetical protein